MIKQFIVKILSRIVKKILAVMPPMVVQKNIPIIVNKLEQSNNAFFTYHLRPKFAKEFSLSTNKEYPEVGIIIQGPLIEMDSFTLETAKLYKKFFKSAAVFVSTWEDENPDYLAKFNDAEIRVILNEKPTHPGALNSNFQIRSTLNAINELEKLGVQYVLKTRSDQRINNYESMDMLLTSLATYPAIDDKQLARIVSINFTTLKYRPYAVGDMLMFGTLQDLKKYWDIPLDERKISREDIVSYSLHDMAEQSLAESFYCKMYLNKIGLSTPTSLAVYHKILQDYFIVLDYQLFDLYWFKYNREIEHRHTYYNPHSFSLVSNQTWSGSFEITDEECILNALEGSKL